MVKINNLNVGLTFLLLSSIIYGSTLISASVYSQVLAGPDGQGWDTRYGVYGTALREVGTLPIILSILLGIIGLLIVVVSIRKN
ncbi:phosphatase [Halalkalibacter urbisdiaboli]|uniref:phosphatase n=1 Tax=Halalkalibacter urbisdiaboli TaxID=1960589 RepID=UPI001FD966C5|nr:phosphatase [Halalkalibacter urbisdiaboli]